MRASTQLSARPRRRRAPFESPKAPPSAGTRGTCFGREPAAVLGRLGEDEPIAPPRWRAALRSCNKLNKLSPRPLPPVAGATLRVDNDTYFASSASVGSLGAAPGWQSSATPAMRMAFPHRRAYARPVPNATSRCFPSGPADMRNSMTGKERPPVAELLLEIYRASETARVGPPQ